jgi:hypothetical protein
LLGRCLRLYRVGFDGVLFMWWEGIIKFKGHTSHKIISVDHDFFLKKCSGSHFLFILAVWKFRNLFLFGGTGV